MPIVHHAGWDPSLSAFDQYHSTCLLVGLSYVRCADPVQQLFATAGEELDDLRIDRYIMICMSEVYTFRYLAVLYVGHGGLQRVVALFVFLLKRSGFGWGIEELLKYHGPH